MLSLQRCKQCIVAQVAVLVLGNSLRQEASGVRIDGSAARVSGGLSSMGSAAHLLVNSVLQAHDCGKFSTSFSCWQDDRPRSHRVCGPAGFARCGKPRRSEHDEKRDARAPAANLLPAAKPSGPADA